MFLIFQPGRRTSRSQERNRDIHNHIAEIAHLQLTEQHARRTHKLKVFRRRNDSDCHRRPQTPQRSTQNPRHNTAPRTHVCGWNTKIARACLYESPDKWLHSDDTITQYSSVIMNKSNLRARGKQACSSLYEPDPGARLPPSREYHTTALSSFSRRAPLPLRGNMHDRRKTNSPSKLRPALPISSERTHKNASNSTAENSRGATYPESAGSDQTRHRVWGAPLEETTSSATTSRIVTSSFLLANSAKCTDSTSTAAALASFHHLVVWHSVVSVQGQHSVQRVFLLEHSSAFLPSSIAKTTTPSSCTKHSVSFRSSWPSSETPTSLINPMLDSRSLGLGPANNQHEMFVRGALDRRPHHRFHRVGNLRRVYTTDSTEITTPLAHKIGRSEGKLFLASDRFAGGIKGHTSTLDPLLDSTPQQEQAWHSDDHRQEQHQSSHPQPLHSAPGCS